MENHETRNQKSSHGEALQEQALGLCQAWFASDGNW